MTRHQALKALRELKDKHSRGTYVDFESAHCAADDILVQYLRTNGNPAIAKAYDELRDELNFRYA